jgi:hypothetical protein
MTLSSIGQTSTFRSLTNDILLRIYSYETDSVTKKFLKKYVPILADKPNVNVGWTAYPPNVDTTPTFTVGHSITYAKHPFVDIGAKECKLEFLNNEKANVFTGYKTFYITFYFDDRQKAINGFKLLSKLYDKVSKTKKLISKNRKKIVFYTNDIDDILFDKVEFILTQDDLYGHKYKIIFGQIIDIDLADFYSS